MTNIKGVIFDLDGTLADSMQIWDGIWEEYSDELGITLRPDQLRKMHSFSSIEEAEYVIKEFGLGLSPQEIVSGRNRLIQHFYDHEVPLKDGVIPVLEALSARGIKMCIASASERVLVEPVLRRCGINEYFGRIFSCGEEETSKSSPDIYIRAAAFMGTGIGETLVVEDALYAIKTAKKAGFPVAGVYDLAADDHQGEIKAICDYYWVSMDEMLAIM